MNTPIYTKTLFITLQNKLAMLKDYLESPIHGSILENLSECAKYLNNNINKLLRQVDDGIDEFTERLELTNEAFNIQFNCYLDQFKEFLPKECFISQNPANRRVGFNPIPIKLKKPNAKILKKYPSYAIKQVKF
jgi:hypothetical protein